MRYYLSWNTPAKYAESTRCRLGREQLNLLRQFLLHESRKIDEDFLDELRGANQLSGINCFVRNDRKWKSAQTAEVALDLTSRDNPVE